MHLSLLRRLEAEGGAADASRPAVLHHVHDDPIHGLHQQREIRPFPHPERHLLRQKSHQEERNERSGSKPHHKHIIKQRRLEVKLMFKPALGVPLVLGDWLSFSHLFMSHIVTILIKNWAAAEYN